MHIIVKACEATPKGELTFDHQTWPCALGPAGLTRSKVEGDGATPVGTFRLLEVLYRADRLDKPDTMLPTSIITEQDGWSDDPDDAAYNSKVSLPYTPSHEKLWREDHAYDLCVILDYNIDPAIPGHGSAIFFHLAKSACKPTTAGNADADTNDLMPTEGCIAITLEAMQTILKSCTTNTNIIIDWHDAS